MDTRRSRKMNFVSVPKKLKHSLNIRYYRRAATEPADQQLFRKGFELYQILRSLFGPTNCINPELSENPRTTANIPCVVVVRWVISYSSGPCEWNYNGMSLRKIYFPSITKEASASGQYRTLSCSAVTPLLQHNLYNNFCPRHVRQYDR